MQRIEDYREQQAELEREQYEGAIIRLDQEIAEASFYHFVLMAWPKVFPELFIDGKHIKAVCDHLQALAEDLFDNLIINIPPGHSKSRIVSVLFPAWMFGPKANRDQWLHASVAQGLAERDSDACRDVLKHPWFQERWPVKFSKTKDTTREWRLVGGGKREVTSPVSKATGKRGRWLVGDDLHDIDETETQTANTIKWIRGPWSNRGNYGKLRRKRIIIMQRVAENDATGFYLESDPTSWVHLCLPLEYDPERHCVTPIFSDWRTKRGQLLWPQAYGPKEVAQGKRDAGPKNWDCQQNQKPHPVGGKEFEPGWLLHRFRRLIASLVERWVVSIDCSFKDGPNTDFVSIQLLAKIGPYFYVVEELTDRMSWNELKAAALEFVTKWRNLGVPILDVVIEEAANGYALCEELKKKVSGVVAWDPKAGKVERARATTGVWSAGQVQLPAEDAVIVLDFGKGKPIIIHLRPHWVSDYVYQHKSFPKPNVHDDSVDATSQGILYLEDFRTKPKGLPNVAVA